jgi:hypothetical protein
MISSTVTQGSFSTGTLTASEPNFVADFADSFSVLRYTAAQSAPGNILSTITFSSALPSGTRLLVIDVDFSMETVTLLGNETPLSLLAQRESTTGASSSFPSYNGATGKLVAVATNSNEASVLICRESPLSRSTLPAEILGRASLSRFLGFLQFQNLPVPSPCLPSASPVSC